MSKLGVHSALEAVALMRSDHDNGFRRASL